MRTTSEILAEIRRITKNYHHVLDRGPASYEINAPVAAMQTSAKSQLDALYWVLDQQRPTFKADNPRLRDH